MTADLGAMQRWRKDFDRLDWCPWPGPAPLDESQHHLLIGRVEDRRRFEAVLKEANRRLILLHAPSGAGKSSLLEAGIKRDLRRKGATIHTVNKWGGLGGADPERFLASKLRLPGERPFERFGELGGSGVLILDQFEELVRYSPTATGQLFEQILKVNSLYKTKVIVSFRSEYLHEFAGLENGAVGYSVASMPISEVEDRFALAVVKSGNRNKHRPVDGDAVTAPDDVPDPIDPHVAQWLADQWTQARKGITGAVAVVGDDPFARVGLLHLQAIVYSLHFAAKREPLTPTKVVEVLKGWEETSPGIFEAAEGVVPASLTLDGFRQALARAVEHKLDHCDEAGRTGDLVDSQLRRGTRWMVERTVEHLSSAGYKLIRSASELALLALGSDHDQLRREQRKRAVMDRSEEALLEVLLAAGLVGDGSDDEGVGPVADDGVEEVSAAATDDGHDESGPAATGAAAADEEQGDPLDLIAADRHQIAGRADKLAPAAGWSALLADPGSQPFENDQFEVTSGYLFGATPADVLIEELRRFAFALAWLEAGDLVRVATPLAGQPMVSVIHDGFGTALNGWAEEARSDPEGVLSALTAPRGFTFAWASRGIGLLRAVRTNEDRPGLWSGTHRVLSNLRWQSGTVEATRLQHIAFLNCDFQGLQFRDCTFEGVVFVNCLLDGAVFSDCTISGDLPFLDRNDCWSPADPTFVVPLDEDPTALFHRYLGEDITGPVGEDDTVQAPAMFCDLPGAAAIPYDGKDTGQDGTRRNYGVERTKPKPGEKPPDKLRVDLVTGGVAIYGGRVSNLVIRHCDFAPTSGVAVRHATGSGLDLVEVRGEPIAPEPSADEASDGEASDGEASDGDASDGDASGKRRVISPSRLEIFGSAVRHLTVSTSPGEVGSVELQAVQAMLPQTFVGTGLTGTVKAFDSSLMQVWNASPPVDGKGGVDFLAANCLIHGALDIRKEGGSIEIPKEPDQIERAAEFIIGGVPLPKRLARMDYRRNPARFRAESQ